MYNPGFNFVKAPMEFNKNTERDTLQYCLGATLYMPGTKDIREKVVNHELPVTSFVMCCEDAIKEEDLPAAEQNILDTMDYFADQIEAGKITQDDIPLIFMRVRNPEQFKSFAKSFGAKVTCLNLEIPDHDPYTDVFVQGKATEVVPKWAKNFK